MSKEKKFPPRAAYSLKEAADFLGCSVAALLDWGNQGYITLCVKITGKTSFGKIKWENPALGIKDDSTTATYPCRVEVRLAAFGQYFAAGQASISVKPLDHHHPSHVQKAYPKAGDFVMLPCRITGFFCLMESDIFALTESETRHQNDIYLLPYGMTQDEKDKYGKCVCMANIALSTDELFVMREEFEKLEVKSLAEQMGTNAASNENKWPWGNYETKNLQLINEVINKFWVRYIPDEPDTAPTSKEVTDWLKKNGVSNNLASAIATIIRADGLRTGPR